MFINKVLLNFIANVLLNTYWHFWHIYLAEPADFTSALQSWHRARFFKRIGLIRNHIKVYIFQKQTDLIFNESSICQLFGTQLTTKALRMPISCHCLNNTSNHKFSTFITTWCKQNMKISFAIFPSFELIKNSVLELTKALGTPTNHKQLN